MKKIFSAFIFSSFYGFSFLFLFNLVFPAHGTAQESVIAQRTQSSPKEKILEKLERLKAGIEKFERGVENSEEVEGEADFLSPPISAKNFPEPKAISLPAVDLGGGLESGITQGAQTSPKEKVLEKLERLKAGIEKFERRVENSEEVEGETDFLSPPISAKNFPEPEAISLPTVDLGGGLENEAEDLEKSFTSQNSKFGGLKPYLGKLDGGDAPMVEEVKGQASFYNEVSGTFKPISRGFTIEKPVLFLTSADSSVVVSFPGKIAARLGQNTRAVLSPMSGGRFEVELRVGTISALLDPKRDKRVDPAFAVRTLSGVTEATGTFYAVAEYKGQTYSAVKKGKISKKTVLPAKPDFSDYLTKSKPKPKPATNKKLPF